MREIEIKYLVRELPADVESYPHKRIAQGYLVVDSEGAEVRLRQKGEKHFLTVKSAGLLNRAEYETELARSQFDTLWPATKGRRVEKVRYDIPFSGRVIELDVYLGELDGLLTAEVEFPTEEACREFSIPPWFSEELTLDARYKNKHLAIHGIPPGPAP